MIYQTNGQIKAIDYGASGNDAIMQNMEFALTTQKNTLFLDRELGWNPPVAEPIQEVEPITAGEVATLLTENIDSIAVESVEFEMNPTTGHVKPKVKVVIDE